jgi:hypothetical protein
MRFVVSLALALTISAAARGAIHSESEVGGISNNTILTAEAIPSTKFTPPVLATIFDPPGWATATIVGTGADPLAATSDLDFYSFTTSGGRAIFDIDNDVDGDPSTLDTLLDTMLSLFDSSGTLIAFNDESAGDPGSGPIFDSFLGVISLTPGTYFVAVTQFPNEPNAYPGPGNPTLIRPDGVEGGEAVAGATPGDSSFPQSGPDGSSPYTLHISLENVAGGGGVIPEPISFVVWSLLGMITVGAATQRTRNSQQADS